MSTSNPPEWTVSYQPDPGVMKSGVLTVTWGEPGPDQFVYSQRVDVDKFSAANFKADAEDMRDADADRRQIIATKEAQLQAFMNA